MEETSKANCVCEHEAFLYTIHALNARWVIFCYGNEPQSLRNYHYSQRNNPEERGCQSLKLVN